MLVGSEVHNVFNCGHHLSQWVLGSVLMCEYAANALPLLASGYIMQLFCKCTQKDWYIFSATHEKPTKSIFFLLIGQLAVKVQERRANRLQYVIHAYSSEVFWKQAYLRHICQCGRNLANALHSE